MCKGWGISSTWGAFVQHMSLSCDSKHAKARCEGHGACRMSALYTEVFAKRVCAFLATSDHWIQFALEVNTAEPVRKCCQNDIDLALVGSEDEGDEADMPPAPAPDGADEVPLPDGQPESSQDMREALRDIPQDVQRHIFKNLKKIHTASGHCNIDYLRRSLKKRGASEQVMRCARFFKCEVCQERRRPDPRHQATLQEIAPKWHTWQCDAGTWTHPETGLKYQFMVGVDEGCRLKVAKILFQHQTKTPNADDFIGFLEEQWFPHFGRPAVLRLDPAGCFRSAKLDRYLSERDISHHHIPAQAHWQLPLAERAVGTLKATMNAVVSEHPEMSASEALCRALWAANHRDSYRGFSPLQHAFGRAPDELGRMGQNMLKDIPILTESGVSAEFGADVRAMLTAECAFLEQQAHERLKRAEASGRRSMKHVYPGDLVCVWRKMTPIAGRRATFPWGRAESWQ